MAKHGVGIEQEGHGREPEDPCQVDTGHGIEETPRRPCCEGREPVPKVVLADLDAAGAPAPQLGPHDGKARRLFVVEEGAVQIYDAVPCQVLLKRELYIFRNTVGVPALTPQELHTEGEARAGDHGGQSQFVPRQVIEGVYHGPVQGVPLADEGIIGVGRQAPTRHNGCPGGEGLVHLG